MFSVIFLGTIIGSLVDGTSVILPDGIDEIYAPITPAALKKYSSTTHTGDKALLKSKMEVIQIICEFLYETNSALTEETRRIEVWKNTLQRRISDADWKTKHFYPKSLQMWRDQLKLITDFIDKYPSLLSKFRNAEEEILQIFTTHIEGLTARINEAQITEDNFDSRDPVDLIPEHERGVIRSSKEALESAQSILKQIEK